MDCNLIKAQHKETEMKEKTLFGEIVEAEAVVVPIGATAKADIIEAVKREGVEESLALVIKSEFSGFFDAAKAMEARAKSLVITSLDQKDEMKQARKMRLELKNIRCAVEKKRKELKEDSVRRGKAIDGMSNVIKALVEPLELHLEAQEKFAKNLEAEKKARIKAEREAELSALGFDFTGIPLADIAPEPYASMLSVAKAGKAAKDKAEAEEKARIEAQAKAEAEERERQRLENIRLKAEAEAREKAIAEERAKVEAERKEAEAKAKKERDALQAQLKAEAEAREKIEMEIKAKAEAEAKAKAQAEREARRLAKAPDAIKLKGVMVAIDGIIIPAMATPEGKHSLEVITGILTKCQKEIANVIAQMEG